jgi:hypothetical protein
MLPSVARRTIKLWQLIIAGPALIAVGIWEYIDVARFEASGGTIWVGRTTAFFYRIGGKSTVLAVMLLAGGSYLWLLARYVRLHREQARIEAEADQREVERASGTRSRPMMKPPLPSPPRIDPDPFRAPPQQPIVVRDPAVRSAPAPIAAGDPSDVPKLLR